MHKKAKHWGIVVHKMTSYCKTAYCKTLHLSWISLNNEQFSDQIDGLWLRQICGNYLMYLIVKYFKGCHNFTKIKLHIPFLITTFSFSGALSNSASKASLSRNEKKKTEPIYKWLTRQKVKENSHNHEKSLERIATTYQAFLHHWKRKMRVKFCDLKVIKMVTVIH